MFQYSFCSYSTNAMPYIEEITRFQYSLCSYSTDYFDLLKNNLTRFQYSFCSYSTQTDWKDKKIVVMFQYSFCSYSTMSKVRSKDAQFVSIQLLFLFNPTANINLLANVGFNTASVLIQPSIFQYSL